MSADIVSPETAVGVCELRGEKAILCNLQFVYFCHLEARGGIIPGRLKFRVSLARMWSVITIIRTYFNITCKVSAVNLGEIAKLSLNFKYRNVGQSLIILIPVLKWYIFFIK